jgi:hypothetical protein
MQKPLLVNIGCGRVWHKDWINLDHQPTAPEVTAFDLRKPLPFPDASVDGLYASHILEHLDMREGRRVLRECRRVLKPGGILRIVVPDLENLCRYYLDRLTAATENPTAENTLAYDFAYLQLLDQHVRRHSGGELNPLVQRPELRTNPAVRPRLSTNLLMLRGDPAAEERARSRGPVRDTNGISPSLLTTLGTRLRGCGKWLLGHLLPRDYAEALAFTSFVRAGELHQVAYDRFSLPRLLRRAGFEEIALVEATRSAIPGFAGMDLDTIGGRVRKPGSLFAEARRPGTAAANVSYLRPAADNAAQSA